MDFSLHCFICETVVNGAIYLASGNWDDLSCFPFFIKCALQTDKVLSVLQVYQLILPWDSVPKLVVAADFPKDVAGCRVSE